MGDKEKTLFVPLSFWLTRQVYLDPRMPIALDLSKFPPFVVDPNVKTDFDPSECVHADDKKK